MQKLIITCGLPAPAVVRKCQVRSTALIGGWQL